MKTALRPSDALQLSGVHPESYAEATRTGGFRNFPATSMGKARQFDADDVVAMAVQAELQRVGVKSKEAWRIANEVRAQLRRLGDECESLYLVAGRDGKPRNCLTRPPPTGVFLTIPIRQKRIELARLIAERQARAAN